MVKEKIQNKTLCENKKALFQYTIVDKYEAGIVLKGYEVKALYEGKGNIKGSFVTFIENIPYIKGFSIGRYSKCSLPNINKDRIKELLLHKNEINKLNTKVTGQTIVPLSVYLKNGIVKIEVALVKGKKDFEKKQKIKDRDTERRIKSKLGKK